jgi:hypothetical protein
MLVLPALPDTGAWNELKALAAETHQSVSDLLTDAIREYVARKRHPVIQNHLEQSITENEALGKLLAQHSTMEPLETTFPDVDEDLPPLDDVTL